VSKGGRPSEGRKFRIQAHVTRGVILWLEARLEPGQTISSLVCSIIEHAKEEYTLKKSRALEDFFNSQEFKQAVVGSTISSRLKNTFYLEIFPDGDWRVLDRWDPNTNKYACPGVILEVPPLTEEPSELSEQEYFDLAFGLQVEEIKVLMRDALHLWEGR
jgi:hypothetical protein